MFEITTTLFLIVITLSLTVYYLLPLNFRWKWILIVSIAFLLFTDARNLIYVFLTSFSIYLCGVMLNKYSQNTVARKRIITLTVVFNISILFIIKYLNPVCSLINNINTAIGVTFNIPLMKFFIPIGLSYYTLQAIAYALDVYWNKIEYEQSYPKMLLYICYFPQILQGPISRYDKLSSQLFKKTEFDIKNIKHGVQLMLWGYFKVLIVPVKVSPYVDKIFFSWKPSYGLNIVFGLIFYGVLLYANFSGGMDIIRGVSQCFGINLTKNFNQPYFSKSLGEFWRRWHMSLGEWMKDYVVFPLVMSKSFRKLKKSLKKSKLKPIANTLPIALSNLVVFFLVGAWHGSESIYIAWGLYNGIILASSTLLANKYTQWKKALHINEKSIWWQGFCLVRTLCIVTIGWVFDCAYTASGAFVHLINAFNIGETNIYQFCGSKWELIQFAGLCFVLFSVDLLHEKNISIRNELDKRNYWIQVIFWTAFIQVLILFSAFTSEGGLMYANF